MTSDSRYQKQNSVHDNKLFRLITNTSANTVGIIHKLVMLFALTFRHLQSFSHRDFTRIAPVNFIKLFTRGLVYRPQIALYRDARSVLLLFSMGAKSTPYPPCTVTVSWPRWRGVPGQIPVLSSGNAYEIIPPGR